MMLLRASASSIFTEAEPKPSVFAQVCDDFAFESVNNGISSQSIMAFQVSQWWHSAPHLVDIDALPVQQCTVRGSLDLVLS